MIKAIAMDLGGVLFFEGKAVAMERLQMKYGYDPQEVKKILRSPQSMDLRRGDMEDEAFWSWARQVLPEGYDAERIRQEWYDGYVLDEAMFALLKGWEGKYMRIAFSGNVKSRVEYLDKKYDFRQHFDLEVYSFDHHLMKPDKEFVEAMIRASKVYANEIAYLDDAEECLIPARELGVKTVLYQTGDMSALQEALVVCGIE